MKTDKNKAYLGKVAVVTGAAAGMGRSLAIQLAEAGARVAVCDVDSLGLEETASRCRAAGAAPVVALVNVAEREAMNTFAARVASELGGVDYVFNNAGIAFAGIVERTEDKDFERVIDVDFWGVYNGTKAFLPYLLESDEGHLVNTSSVFGLFAVPSQSAYNAAKFAVRGFTESLRQEMLASGHNVKVSCVHPGGIRTDVARNATSAEGEIDPGLVGLFDKLALTSSDAAAGTILRGAAQGKPRILVGPDAHVMDLTIRLLGSRYQRPLAWAAGRALPQWFRPGSGA